MLGKLCNLLFIRKSRPRILLGCSVTHVLLTFMLLIADVRHPGSVFKNGVEQVSEVISINYPSLSLELITICSGSLRVVTCTDAQFTQWRKASGCHRVTNQTENTFRKSFPVCTESAMKIDYRKYQSWKLSVIIFRYKLRSVSKTK